MSMRTLVSARTRQTPAGCPSDMLHPFEPVWDQHSRILILGSFPSVASRAIGFYYGHPRNRFWQMLSAVYGETVPQETEGKVRFLLAHQLALWDALASCEVAGSADADIRSAVPNNLLPILSGAPVRRVIANGQLAGRAVQSMRLELPSLETLVMPSTSPANAAWSLERLCAVWKEALLA